MLFLLLVPSAPGNFMLSMVLGLPNTLSASWTAPDPPNGIISGYTIYCSTLSGLLPPFVIIGLNTSTRLEGLKAFTEYTCSISANTSAGEGPHSNTEVTATDEDGKTVRR